MSLASVITTACDELGINRPWAGMPASADQQTRQLVALLARAGLQLVQDFQWQALLQPYTITTVAGVDNYALPGDFLAFVDDTQWNTSGKMPLNGPINQQVWSRNQYGLSGVGPFYRQQIRGDKLYLQPTPTAVNTLNFYYRSAWWVLQGGTVAAPTFSGDTDTFLLDEQLLTLSLKWRWLRAKGLDYAEEREQFEVNCNQQQQADRGSSVLSLDPAARRQGVAFGVVIPLTGYGGP